MKTPASVHGHPMHPMLVAVPIGLWIFSLVCDLIYSFGWGGVIWNTMALYSMMGGVLGALGAAVPGYLDFRSLIDPRVVRVGKMHMLINLTVVGLYAVNIWLRMVSDPGAMIPLLLSILTVSLLGVSGWLGGELVFAHGVGVDTRERSSASVMKKRVQVA
ncbi:MAG: DUF2231 domain-containing protein [Nitrospiraceae bacterium]